MHKVPKGKIRSWFFERNFPYFILPLVTLFTSIPVLAEGYLFGGFLIFLFSVLGCFYVWYKFEKKCVFINKNNQPLPTEVINNFHLWQEGDTIQAPQKSVPKYSRLKGKFKGVKDDGSIVIKVDHSMDGPKEKMDGEKVPSPRIFEIPPLFFDAYSYLNSTLRDRKRAKLEDKSLQELKNSSLNEALKEVRSDLQNQDEEELKKSTKPRDIVRPV